MTVMAENNPAVITELPSGASEETRKRTGKYVYSLDQTPAKRELGLLRDSAEYFKHQCQVITEKYDNSQILLRTLYQLDKEKHYFMCNALFSAIVATTGGLIMNRAITLNGLISEAAAGALGGALMFVSLILGVGKPLLMELLWKIFSKRVYTFKCPHCQAHLTDKEALKE